MKVYSCKNWNRFIFKCFDGTSELNCQIVIVRILRADKKTLVLSVFCLRLSGLASFLLNQPPDIWEGTKD